MTGHLDILDQRDSLRGAFGGALALHALLVGGVVVSRYLGQHDTLGSPDAGGGAIGIEAVKSLPILHRGMENPVANDTKSELPQIPERAKEANRKEKEDPDAVALKRNKKKKEAVKPAPKQKFRPFDQLDANQLTSRQPQQVSSTMFSAAPGAGRVGAGINTTLGNSYPAYAEQLQRLISQKWRTADVDASIRTGPVVIATFDLLRNGNARNVQLLQRSGIPTLDLSVQRAILEASPFPPFPAGLDRESLKVEFWFELKR